MQTLLFASSHALFGTKHLIIVGVSILLIVGLYILSRKLSIKTLSKIMLGVGLVSETVKVFSYIVMNENKVYTTLYKMNEATGGLEPVKVLFNGVLPKTDLPFQLCSLQIIFILVAVLVKNEKVQRFIYGFMMPSCLFGGIAAILIATESSRNVWVITFQYFLYHIAIVVFALRLLTAKEMKWKVRDLLNAFIMLTGVIFFAIYINSMMFDGISDVNFMYVVKPPQKGLPYLNKDNGWLSYIFRYAILVVFCVSLCYIKAIIDTIKDKKSKKAIEQENEAEIITK
jgi:uncharacterized membrane protein YwaF